MRLAVTGPVFDTERLLDEPFVLSASRTDYLVVLGGCGLTSHDRDVRDAVEEFSNLPCGVLFLDAEHDDHDLLAEYPAYPWNGGLAQMFSRCIYRLCRGQVFDLCGLRVLTMGGRTTPDRDDRDRYCSWWPEQGPSAVDVYTAVRSLGGDRADLVLSSDHPSSFSSVSSEPTESQMILDYLRSHISYDCWLFSDGSSDHSLQDFDAVCIRDSVLRVA